MSKAIIRNIPCTNKDYEKKAHKKFPWKVH